MTEAAASQGEHMEFEIRGGPWEGIHVVIFYGAVISAVLATIGVMRLPLGIGCIVLLFYSMFTIFSSPTFVISDPAAQELVVERYHYFIPSHKRIEREELEGLEVIESPRVPEAEGEQSARHDLSYYVRVYLIRTDGRRLRLFSSGMTGAPLDNRTKAFLIVQGLARDLDIPVSYTRRGLEVERAAEPRGA
jgi:hypothetical protein